MINKEKALELLSVFKPEYNFTGDPPVDIIEFAKCLGWEEGPDEETRPLAVWSGEQFIGDFLDKWKFDHEIASENGKTISQDHLNYVGLAVKYEFAWEIVSSLLFENSNLPKELLPESANDMECSIVLSRERYFKQAFQVLRNYCEICVSIMYFHRNNIKYREWVNDKNGWRFPAYSEMLNQLGDYLADRETRYLRRSYRKLNHSVHSKRRRLNMNIVRLERATHDYYVKDTLDWSEQFIRIAKFMTDLYLRKYFC